MPHKDVDDVVLAWFVQDIAGGTPAMSHPAGALPLPIGTQEHVFHLVNSRSEAGDCLRENMEDVPKIGYHKMVGEDMV